MPANRASLQITEAYRGKMVALRERAQHDARDVWGRIDQRDLDGTYEVGLLAVLVTAMQREAARLSSGYLQAFIQSELGRSIRAPMVDARQVGQARNGDELRKALVSPLITTKGAIKDGKTPAEALVNGRAALERMVGLATDTAARESLRRGMEDSPHVDSWQRAVKGTCGACMGSAKGRVDDEAEPLHIHPNCQCVSEPVVKSPQSHKDAAKAIRDQLTQWKHPDQDTLDRAEKTWAKRLKDLMSTDAEARKAISDAVERNESSEFFQGLITKYGGGKDNVVILDQVKAQADDLLRLEGLGAQRLGGTTFMSDASALSEGTDVIAGALRHEFSHSLWNEWASAGFKQEFRERLATLPRSTLANRTDRLEFTNYLEAWSRDDEAFCEAIRVVSAPDYDSAAFSPEFRQLAGWLRSL